MQIARDAPALCFGFVRQLQTRVGQFAICGSQSGAGAMNAPVLEITPAQGDQREQQQNAERRRGQRKGRPRNRELEREWDRWRQVFGKRLRQHFVFAGFQFLHRELGIVRHSLPDNFS